MTFNELFLAQAIERQHQTDVVRTHRHEAVRVVREAQAAERQLRRLRRQEARALRRNQRPAMALRGGTAAEPQPTS
jgi:hypothetical protein